MELRIYEILLHCIPKRKIELKLVKTIPTFNKTFNVDSIYNFSWDNYLLTDELDVIKYMVNYAGEELRFNSIDLKPYFEGKMGRNDNRETWKLTDVTFVVTNGYLIAFSSQDAYALKLDHKS